MQPPQFCLIPLRAEPSDKIGCQTVQQHCIPDDRLDAQALLFFFSLRIIRAIEAFDDTFLPVDQLGLHAFQAHGFFS